MIARERGQLLIYDSHGPNVQEAREALIRGLGAGHGSAEMDGMGSRVGWKPAVRAFNFLVVEAGAAGLVVASLWNAWPRRSTNAKLSSVRSVEDTNQCGCAVKEVI